jgi:hypothetical protein
MRVRIATCLTLPEPDPDEQLLLGALAARGVDATMCAWDDPSVDWDAPVPTVIRSTWNYHFAREAFVAWAERASRAAPLHNPAHVVTWNSHKRYLVELESRGVAATPTELVERGETAELGEILARRGWQRVVVKPAVSGGSFATRRFDRTQLVDGQAFLVEQLAARDMMVQQYLESVDGYGERSLVHIDGEITHAIRKTPRFSGDDEAVTGPLPIMDDERALAAAALAPFDGQLLYGRVDLARDAHNIPRVMELELIEPSLFLLQHRPALDRLVEAIARRAQN